MTRLLLDLQQAGSSLLILTTTTAEETIVAAMAATLTGGWCLDECTHIHIHTHHKRYAKEIEELANDHFP